MPIDFENSKILKLAPTTIESQDWLKDLLVEPSEKGVLAFHGVRDSVVFTNDRAILRNVKGVGVEVATTSIPYNRINAFCVESTGVVGISVRVTLYVGNIPPITMEFTRETDVKNLNALLSRAIFTK